MTADVDGTRRSRRAGAGRQGRCLCGGVRYRVDGPLRDILVCHCSECRRWAGRAWAATAAHRADLVVVDDGSLAWVDSPESAAQARRGFCRACGTSLFWDAPGRDTVSFSPGTLDDPSLLRLVGHIWLEQGSQYEAPDDGVVRYPRGWPPDEPPLSWID